MGGEAETSDVSILLPKSFVFPNSPDIYQPQNEEFVENESIEEKSRKFMSKKSPRVRKNAFSCVENFDKETELQFIAFLVDHCLFEQLSDFINPDICEINSEDVKEEKFEEEETQSDGW